MSFPLSAVRILGSGAVIAAGGLLGYRMAAQLDHEISEMNRFESLLLSLKTEISYALLPLPKALSKCGERVGGTVGQAFARVGAKTGPGSRMTPEEALSLVLDDLGQKMPRHQVPLIEDLFRNLGTSGHKEQVAHIDAVLDSAKALRRSLEDNYRKKARIYRYLGVLGAISVVIVLL
ncbi:MAG: hypothetical protein ACOX3V_01560 [Bacillota bacterium]